MTSRLFYNTFKTLFTTEIPAVGAEKGGSAAKIADFLNPFTGDITAKFINYATMFVTVYGAQSFLHGHHDHQDVQYPYMKTKRRITLAHKFTAQE